MREAEEQSESQASLVLGIDPGLHRTGYGVVALRAQRIIHIESGVIARRESDVDVRERLDLIYATIKDILRRRQPVGAAVEQVFMARNAATALKLGLARGAAIAALSEPGLQFAEYSARSVKLSVTGSGKADKEQVRRMIKSLLRLPELPPSDAADALAVAICHANTGSTLGRIAAAGPGVGARTGARA